MERVEQLLSLESDQSEDIMLRDFVNKRAMLLNETMRKLAFECNSLCSAFAQPRTSEAAKD